MGFRAENVLKNAKNRVFGLFLAPQGVCSKLSNFFLLNILVHFGVFYDNDS